MDISLLKNTKTELEIDIRGASETLLIPLLNKTLSDSKVDYALKYGFPKLFKILRRWGYRLITSVFTSHRFRTFNVVDDFNREALAIEVDLNLPDDKTKTFTHYTLICPHFGYKRK